VATIRDRVTHYEGGKPFFQGETEPCINGRVLAAGAYFGEPDQELLDRLLGEQLEDGGWNCEAPKKSRRSSFHTTVCVLEGLLTWERALGPDKRVREARRRGEAYILDRRLFRSRSTGEVIDHAWLRSSFPLGWEYDILRGLDYLRRSSLPADERVAEALAIVRESRGQDGRWLLPARYPEQYAADLGEREGEASRWMTLRSLRVQRWGGAPQ